MTATKTYREILAAGLYSCAQEEPYFTWQGCDVCAETTGKRLGNNVYDVAGYASLEDARKGKDMLYEFRACDGCIYDAEYGVGTYG